MKNALPCVLSAVLLAGCAAAPVTPAPGPATPPAVTAPAKPPPAPEPASRAPAVKQYDAKTFFENVRIFPAGFSRDGTKVLMTSDVSGVLNVYAQPVAGGDPVRLTTSQESQWAVDFFPADDRFLYSEDKGGNEISQLWVMEPGGKPKNLTPGDKVKAQPLEWSKDGASFWATTNERDPKAFDVYRYATKDYKRELVFQNDEVWTVGAVSRDGRWLALSKVRTNADNDLYLVDLKKKAKPTHITPHKGDVEHRMYGFSPDSAKLWYGTNGHGEFVQAWSYDPASGKHQAEVAASWDVIGVYFSEGGRYRVVATNEDANTVVRVTDTKLDRDVVLPTLPAGELTGVFFSKSETLMGFLLKSDRSPSDLWVLNLANGEPRQLTRTLNPEIDPSDLVDAAVVRYPSFDGLAVPALLYKPKGAAADRKAPALVLVHGGPGGQTRLGYSAMIQHLVNHGYAVLGVNNRGSSGYGKTFHHMDDRKHGDVDLKDCVWGRKYLETLDWVDGRRVGIIGGSYGGYMVAAALAFTPDAFNAGIDIFGVTNWVRTLESTPPYWAAFRDALFAEMGDPAKDKERLHAISPLFHAAKIKKPLLVVQGKNDPRVLKVESDEIVAAVKKNGVPVEYLVFDDEGHGFLKKKNQIAASDSYLRFLDQHMR
jgi:dipeptidyl aminopeptidase/acylaminoacyl peptidase